MFSKSVDPLAALNIQFHGQSLSKKEHKAVTQHINDFLADVPDLKEGELPEIHVFGSGSLGSKMSKSARSLHQSMIKDNAVGIHREVGGKSLIGLYMPNVKVQAAQEYVGRSVSQNFNTTEGVIGSTLNHEMSHFSNTKMINRFSAASKIPKKELEAHFHRHISDQLIHAGAAESEESLGKAFGSRYALGNTRELWAEISARARMGGQGQELAAEVVKSTYGRFGMSYADRNYSRGAKVAEKIASRTIKRKTARQAGAKAEVLGKLVFSKLR